MVKVLITVEGGIVQNVSASHPDVIYVVVDFDKHAEERVSITDPCIADVVNSKFYETFEQTELDRDEIEIYKSLKSNNF